MPELKLKSILQKCGVVGAGGAGFPSYGKLTDGADLLVINCIECEPLMYTDYELVREKLPEIVQGAQLVMEHTNIKHAVLAIKAYRAMTLGLADNQELAPGIHVKTVPNIYPMGDEINLIYQVTGRLIKPGNLPISQGVIVYNGETVYNIRNAVHENMPVITKWLTIGGDIPKAYTVKVPVGMRISDVLKAVNVTVPPNYVMFDGGPSMGIIKNPASDVVVKTTKALLIVPDNIPAVVQKQRTVEQNLRLAASTCCSCTRCTDLCPRHLLGYPLEPHKLIRAGLYPAQETPELIRTASLCCSCDICGTFSCCQGISPMMVIKEYKKILAQKGMKYVAAPGQEFYPSDHRDSSMLVSQKWKEVLGVAKFDKHPTYIPKDLTADKVEIRMRQHIGVPSVPCVAVGDKVEVGQMIATAGPGLSVPQYASITGSVTFVDENKIIIEA